MTPLNTPPKKDRIDWVLWSLCVAVLVAFGLFIGWSINWGDLW